VDDESTTRAQRLATILADLDRFLRDDAKTGKSEPFYLSPAQSHILAYVAQEGRPSEIAIARHLNVTGPTVVRMVDTLEDKGFVVRTRSKPDRRRVTVSVTEDGARVLNDYTAWREQRLGKIVQRLPAKTVTALIRNLSALLAAQDDRCGG
jgi:DNA-binding MarR family transcriptional regulator